MGAVSQSWTVSKTMIYVCVLGRIWSPGLLVLPAGAARAAPILPAGPAERAQSAYSPVGRRSPGANWALPLPWGPPPHRTMHILCSFGRSPRAFGPCRITPRCKSRGSSGDNDFYKTNVSDFRGSWQISQRYNSLRHSRSCLQYLNMDKQN